MVIQSYCKAFRENTLKLTLKEVSEISGTDLKTISAFENLRSSNIMHLQVYLKSCVNDEQRTEFATGIGNILYEQSKQMGYEAEIARVKKKYGK